MLHASALCTSHYRNMLSQSEAKHDIENTRGSPYESKTVLRSRRLVVQNHPDVSELIKNVTALDTQFLTGLLFISVSYQSIVNILSRVLHKAEEKVGLLSSLIKQTMQSLTVKRSKCACAFLILIFLNHEQCHSFCMPRLQRVEGLFIQKTFWKRGGNRKPCIYTGNPSPPNNTHLLGREKCCNIWLSVVSFHLLLGGLMSCKEQRSRLTLVNERQQQHLSWELGLMDQLNGCLQPPRVDSGPLTILLIFKKP